MVSQIRKVIAGVRERSVALANASPQVAATITFRELLHGRKGS